VFCEHFRTYRPVNEHSCAFFLIIQLSLHIQGDWFQDPYPSSTGTKLLRCLIQF
jgi:hypothetical protein